MAQTATIKIDASDLKRLREKLSVCPEISRKAMAYAMNRALSKAVTFSHEEIRKEYTTIKQKDVKGISKKQRAYSNNLNASITFSDTRLRASFFPHRISRSKNRSPVTLRIKHTPATSGSNPIMFGEGTKQRRGAKGSREVYKRSPGSRTVRPVRTLAIPQMIAGESVFDGIQEKLGKDYLERLEHELDYRLGLLD